MVINTALTPPMASNNTSLCVVVRLAAPAIFGAKILNHTAASVPADYKDNNHGQCRILPYPPCGEPTSPTLKERWHSLSASQLNVRTLR